MNTEASRVRPPQDETETGAMYLTFFLAGEEYGIDILRVQEIRGWTAVTRMPNTPAYMKGVLNLRGAIIPVLDMRLRLGLEPLEYGPATVVIVVWVKSAETERAVGLVVDAVAETYTIAEEQIREAPPVSDVLSPEFVAGLATLEDKMVVLLALDELLNSGDLAIESPEAEVAQH